jgi:nucleotide-binding universal stress UspA family protein
MYKHILVPTDGTALSLKAARAAAGLAAKTGARITTIHVIPPFQDQVTAEGAVYHVSYTRQQYENEQRKHSERAGRQVAKLAGRVRCDHVSAVDADPWEAIVDAARLKKCDLIVMASHGRRGLAGLLLGSETQKVLTHSKVPVLVCR